MTGVCDDDVAYFYPLHYEPRYAYPLLVWIEPPAQQAGRFLRDVMPHVSLRNLVALSVPAGFWKKVDALKTLLARARRQIVFEPRRVWLAGIEASGTAALERAAEPGAPDLAGAVSLGGPFPATWARAVPARLGTLPVFLAAWPELEPDTTARIREDARRAHESGLPVTFIMHEKTSPGWVGALREAHAWIMRRVSA